jgi:hypothetical protein
MSDVAKDIADYLAAQSVGTVGTDIFYDQMTTDPVTVAHITVIESGGLDPEINADRKHFNPTIQIIVTGTQESNTDAKAKVAAVMDLLTNQLSLTVDDTTYHGSTQIGGNNFLGYDENNRPEWSLNFGLKRREEQ